MSATIKIFSISLVVSICIFLISCGGTDVSVPTKVPEIIESETTQENVYRRTQYLVREITLNPIARSDIRVYLKNCKFYMQGVDTNVEYDLDGSRCLILAAREVPEDYTIAVTDVTQNGMGDWVSFAILYPWELSDETLKRIIYHEAVHMVDYLDNPVCLDSASKCRIDEEFEAHNETLVLFEEFLYRNGFSDFEIENFNPENQDDIIVQFGLENSISQVDFDIFVQDVVFLKEKMKGNLYLYLKSYLE